MGEYKMTIGLEIHAELKTKSKMFCGCINDPLEKTPNTNVCPICMGHPGTLPVINKEAVRYVLLVGTALGARVADFTEFDRKNYFYPDIPKGYQISQYKYPLVSGGSLNGVKLTRVHLEEDTARSSHSSNSPQTDADLTQTNAEKEAKSLVDFNRAGVPLMELVTEPVMHTSAEAVNFAKELQLLLQYLGVSGANMEKGEMRIEANISVAPIPNLLTRSVSKLGTKVEIKNINSFRAVGKAIEFELKRQTEILGSGGNVVQETRGWDENKQATVSQRLKESAHDYRYFPDPDLPKLMISEVPEFALKELVKSLPELPSEKRTRYKKDFGIKSEDIESYVNNPKLALWFEEVTKILKTQELIRLASNYITNDMVGFFETVLVKGTAKYPSPENFAKLILMNFEKKINSAVTKKLLGNLVTCDENPEKVALEEGMAQQNDEGALKNIARKIIAGNSKAVKEYKEGKESVLQFLVGQAMKETGNSANPELIKKFILELLK